MARILVADDDVDYLTAFSEGMEVLGHDVVCASSSEDVNRMLSETKFDAIFLDVVMPGGGAISLVHSVRQHDSEVPVIVITGRPELINSPLFRDGMRQAQAKLQKTATLQELDSLVRRLTE